jgi:ABC-2 type transport system permease protein
MAERPLARQFPTAFAFAVRNQSRNRLAWILLVAFVPVWYVLMVLMVNGEWLDFRLFSTGALLHVNGRHLTLLTAGMNSLTLIVGFAVFAAVRRALPLDRRLVFAGYRQSRLIAAKTLAIAFVGGAIALYASLVLLAFWRPAPAAWFGILACFAVLSTAYGALGLLLGVLVKGDLEGFFLIIMISMMDTFLQNPLGNPLANKPVLQYFPSFGPMQFASGGAFADSWLWGALALGLAWTAAFAVLGLVVFQLRTRNRRSSAGGDGNGSARSTSSASRLTSAA